MQKKTWSSTIILIVLTLIFILGAGVAVYSLINSKEIPSLQAMTISLNIGDLIKGESSSSVYYYGQDEKRHPFPNEATYFSWFSDFSQVKVISDNQLFLIPLGRNITVRPGTKLVKIQTDPKVYAVEPDGVLRWIKTEEIAKSLYGNDWAKRVIDIPSIFFTNYTLGSDITSLNEYPTGSLVTSQLGGTVYYIQNDQKRPFLTERSFKIHHFFWSDVIVNPAIGSLSEGERIINREDDLYYLDISSPLFPTAPTGLLATALTSYEIKLSWIDTSDNEEGFRVERKIGVDGIYSQIATVGTNITIYSDIGLSAGTTYYYRVRTYNATGNSVYSNEAFATPPDIDSTPPVRSNGSPSGILPAGTTQTTLSLNTNENAVCKYSTIPGVAYQLMEGDFSSTGQAFHSTIVTGLIDGGVYSYYIKCMDFYNHYNTDDFLISFSVKILCIENWSCGSWSACVNNQQTQTCTDLNSCGTTLNKPPASQFCKLTCPFECCFGEQNYFDKFCSQNKICQNHQCSSISELYTGHNDITRNRLNILFIGADYASFTDFERIAKDIIAFQNENDRGLMQIKPFNESGLANGFNFWIDRTNIQTGVSYQNLTNQIMWETLSSRLNSALTDFNNTYRTNLTRSSRNFLAVLIGNVNPHDIPGYGYGGGSFGRTLTFTAWHSERPWFSWNDMIVTHVHELIHSIPELFDEYGGSGSIYDNSNWQTMNYKGQFFVPGSSQDPGETTKDQFLALSLEEQYDYVKANSLWKNLIGNGCGQNGVIDCFNEEEYRTNRNFVPSNPGDKSYDLEIGIFEGGFYKNSHVFRSTKNNIMNYPYGLIPSENLGFGEHVENLIRDIVTNEFDNSSTSH